ncbi:MAG: hypothetical protein JWN04_4204 [Myxococcaceae bacterium]|nr:hypothetical protein [Myxococcaceae bacterium]
MSKLLKNNQTTPLTIQIAGFVPNVIPAAMPCANPAIGVTTPSMCRISEGHYAALLALDPSDQRRVNLGTCELVADTGSFSPF